jgi:segregation and condensation protein B
LDTVELKAVIEGLVFAADAPIRPERIAEILEEEKEQVTAILLELTEEYRLAHRGFLLHEVAEGFQFRTRPEYGDWMRRLSKGKPFRFSRPALETLSIIAYRQPVTRAEIEYLRGVDSGGVLKTLLEKHLVRILGKKDVPGRPILYGTTREFLELFGLKDLAGLPTLKEFNELNLEDVEGNSAGAEGSETQ